MTVAKPSTVFQWATNPPDGALTQPISSLISSGYDFQAKPAFSDWNWMMNNIAQWIAYVNALNTQTFKVAIPDATPAFWGQSANPNATSAGTMQLDDTTAMAAGVGASIWLRGLSDATTQTPLGGFSAEKANATSGNLMGILAFYSNRGSGLVEGARLNELGHILIGTQTDRGTGAALQVTGGSTFDSVIVLGGQGLRLAGFGMGSLSYFDANGQATPIPGNIMVTRKALIQVGSGSAAGVPAFDTLQNTDMAALLGSAAPQPNGTATPGISPYGAHQDHVHPGGGSPTASLTVATSNTIAINDLVYVTGSQVAKAGHSLSPATQIEAAFVNAFNGLSSCSLQNGAMFSAYTDNINSNRGRAAVSTQNGTAAPTAGTVYALSAANISGIKCCALSNNRVLVAYTKTSDTTHVYLQVLTITGTTITPEIAETSITQTLNADFRICALGVNTAVMLYTDGTGISARVFTATTSITAGTALVVTTSSSYGLSLATLPGNRLCVAYTEVGGMSYVRVLALDTATTLVMGKPYSSALSAVNLATAMSVLDGRYVILVSVHNTAYKIEAFSVPPESNVVSFLSSSGSTGLHVFNFDVCAVNRRTAVLLGSDGSYARLYPITITESEGLIVGSNSQATTPVSIDPTLPTGMCRTGPNQVMITSTYGSVVNAVTYQLNFPDGVALTAGSAGVNINVQMGAGTISYGSTPGNYVFANLHTGALGATSTPCAPLQCGMVLASGSSYFDPSKISRL